MIKIADEEKCVFLRAPVSCGGELACCAREMSYILMGSKCSSKSILCRRSYEHFDGVKPAKRQRLGATHSRVLPHGG